MIILVLELLLLSGSGDADDDAASSDLWWVDTLCKFTKASHNNLLPSDVDDTEVVDSGVASKGWSW